MSSPHDRRDARRCLALAGLLALAPLAAQAAAPPAAAAQPLATRLIAAGDCAGGLAVVVGAADAGLAVALAQQRPFVVHSLAATPELTAAQREVVQAQGLYGPVSVDTQRAADRLPYTDNLANLVVVAAPAATALPLAEVVRVLAPLGLAALGQPSPAAGQDLAGRLRAAGLAEVTVEDADGAWVRFRKPWPAEIDEWTHYLHGPDGNAVARDRVVGPARHYQWVSEPVWLRCHETDSSVSTVVTARGRLLAIVDQAPISLPGQHPLPDEWSLVARDAFNGLPLWTVPIRRWGWREWKKSWFLARPGDIPLNLQKRLVAVGDRVYVTLGYQAPVSEIDARTGEVLRVYPGTERTNEILCLDGRLYLSVLDGRQARVLAFEAATGACLWRTAATYRGSTTDYIRWKEMNGGTEPVELDPGLNLATDGRALALLDGPDLVCLDAASGAPRWRTPFPTDPADLTAGGIQSKGEAWIGALIVAPGAVLCASPGKLAAFSPVDGRLLWSQPKKFIGHLWYEWKDVFVVDDRVWTWSADLQTRAISNGGKSERATFPPSVRGYDLLTGGLGKEVALGPIYVANHHHRCYRNKATVRYILTSRRGTEYVNLEGGEHVVDNWVRGTCHVGMMPANGLHYAPPHPCACYIEEKLTGFNALAPARAGDDRDATGADPAAAMPVCEPGPALAQPPAAAPPPVTPDDWPTFRHDASRSGATPARVPDITRQLWRTPVGRRLSAPIAVGDRLYAALVDEHQVVCLDAADGRLLWRHTAGGRIDSPPTWHNGALLVGAADGWVYALRATDGQRLWRTRIAPDDRLIGAYDQLESAWPVPGSVLVANDTAYAVAGRSSHLDGGLFLTGLRPADGTPVCRQRLQGPEYTSTTIEHNVNPPQGALPDILVSDGQHLYMRNLAFGWDLQRQPGKPDLRAGAGLLDPTYFKRTPWTLGGEHARLIVHDSRSAYYVRMFDSLRGLDPTVFFTPGAQGYLLFARNLTTGGKASWSGRIPVRIRAMALAADRLFTAGPPDVIDAKDPLGAFEGRQGGLLHAIAAGSGDRLTEHRLPSPPVFNGIAATPGRLFLCLEDGSVACFGRN